MNGNFVIAVERPSSGAFPGRLATICGFAGASLLLHNNWIERGEAGELRVMIKGRVGRKAITALLCCSTKMKRWQIVTSIAVMVLSYGLTIQCLVLFLGNVSYSQ
jgi:hypothetical protein